MIIGVCEDIEIFIYKLSHLLPLEQLNNRYLYHLCEYEDREFYQRAIKTAKYYLQEYINCQSPEPYSDTDSEFSFT